MSITRLMLVLASAVLTLSDLSIPVSQGVAAASREPAAQGASSQAASQNAASQEESQGAAAEEAIRIRVTDFPRPLMAAVRQIEGQFGRVVTYEDPAYVYSGDIVDVTAQVSRSGDMSKRILGMRSGSLDISYVPRKRASSIEAQVEDVLRAVVKQANAADLPGDYSVRVVPGGFHVVPTSVNGKNGIKEPFATVLDTRITIPETEDGILEILALLGQTISQSTGTLVAPGSFPQGGFARARATIVARDEPARDVLWRVLQSVSPNLSFEALCEVGEKSPCYFSIHGVRQGYVNPVFR